jgi:hypothetical protein
VDVTASQPGYLDAWVDFEANGTWAEATDRIFQAQFVPLGTTSLDFMVPATAAEGAVTYARFRLSGQGNLPYTGPCANGEVEDYEVTIAFGEDFKYEQMPDLNPTGMDVNTGSGYILADDFLCNETGHIDEIRIWGSWLNDYLPFGGDPLQIEFTLSLHEDIPDSASSTGYSMPGRMIWMKRFIGPVQFTAEVYTDRVIEGWLDPPEGYIFPADSTCWLYTFTIPPDEHVYQVGTEAEPKVYWLDVQAQPYDPEARFGWKTSLDHWNDDAVWGEGIEPYEGPWYELVYPPGHEMYLQSVDLAFVIIGSASAEVPLDVVPRELGLNQNVPNPFNPTTTVAYDVPSGGTDITIEIFDVAGRRVRTLVNRFEDEGRHQVTWNGRDNSGRQLPPGVYFCKLSGDGLDSVREMVLLK